MSQPIQGMPEQQNTKQDPRKKKEEKKESLPQKNGENPYPIVDTFTPQTTCSLAPKNVQYTKDPKLKEAALKQGHI